MGTSPRKPKYRAFPQWRELLRSPDTVVVEIIRLSDVYQQEDCIVCVSHCDVIRLIVAHLLGMPLDTFQRLRVSPASLSVLNLYEGKAFLESVNQTF